MYEHVVLKGTVPLTVNLAFLQRTLTKRCLIYLFPLKQINPCIYEDMQGSKAALHHLSLTHLLFLLPFLLGNFSLALFMCSPVSHICVSAWCRSLIYKSLSSIHLTKGLSQSTQICHLSGYYRKQPNKEQT